MIRFFTYCLTEFDDIDIVECSESWFIELAKTGIITYARHTVRENGVNQTCLTVEPISSYPYESEVKL